MGTSQRLQALQQGGHFAGTLQALQEGELTISRGSHGCSAGHFPEVGELTVPRLDFQLAPR